MTEKRGDSVAKVISRPARAGRPPSRTGAAQA